MISASVLSRSAAVRHRFFTREGGVSEAPYDSLNCGLGSGDDAGRVRENRARAMATLGLPPPALTTAYQVHSAAVAVVDRPWPVDARPQVDALVTRRPGVALGILTADCAPVLLADPEQGVVGAAHAGWRGARDGVLEATVGAMVAEGASVAGIVAAIGPCIRQPSYEVGPEFRAGFVAADADSERFFLPASRAGHAHFDLAGYVARRLAALGIGAVEDVGGDTREDQRRFFSYRRTTLDGGGAYGRLLSVIALAR